MSLQQPADQLIPELAPAQQKMFVAGGAAAAVSVIGLFLNPAQFFQSYLMAYLFVLGASLGCLGLGMIHQLSGGAWGVVTRRLIGASSRILPVLTVLFIPILLGRHYLFEWTHADVVAHDEVLQHKQLYLNTPFFILRAVVYFAVWNALVYFLNRWSLEQDRTPDPRIARRMQALSGAGLLAYAITVTFASFDWLMSLDPHWFSTIYGVLLLGGQGLTALAMLIVALVWLSRRAPLDAIVVPGHFHDLGNLMLAFVLLWAYFCYSQYLIIFSANLPEEITWYLHRLHTSWKFIALVLVLFHFAVPFLLLLSRKVKRTPDLILKIALAILAARLIDLYWLIAPQFHQDGLVIHWLDITLPVALCAGWLGCFVWQLRGRAILPVHDPQFEQALGRIASAG